MKRGVYILIFFISYFLTNIVFAEDLTSNNFILRSPTIDVGGGTSTSNSFQAVDFLGQNTIGESTSTAFTLQSGLSYINEPIFTVTAPSSVNYNSASVSTGSQDSSGTLSGVTVTNTRATTTGWSLVITTTNLTTVGASSKISGDNNTVTFSGSYTGVVAPNTAGIYTVEITTGGTVGVAIFKWTDPAGITTTNVTSASNVTLNSGISVNFNPATYVIGDKWILRVDSLGYTDLVLQPGTPAISFGDTGVTVGSNGSFSGTGATSNTRTLMIGEADNSNGKYIQSNTLIQTIHANTLEGIFDGTITVTLS